MLLYNLSIKSSSVVKGSVDIILFTLSITGCVYVSSMVLYTPLHF